MPTPFSAGFAQVVEGVRKTSAARDMKHPQCATQLYSDIDAWSRASRIKRCLKNGHATLRAGQHVFGKMRERAGHNCVL